MASVEPEQPTPYRDAAHTYRAAGWVGVIPVPYRTKRIRAEGWTGHNGAWPSGADVQAWVDSDARDEGGGNVVLRMPPDVIGIDVDAYSGKTGGVTFAEHEQRWGALPPTWMSTARDDGVSGIRFYRVPEGLRWPGQAGTHIEIIQTRHRYAVVWPSVHPDAGRYRWYRPDGIASTAPPRPDELPELPDAWLAGLTGGQMAEAVSLADLSDGQTREWLVAHSRPGVCRAMTVVRDRLLTDMRSGSAHESLRRLLGLVRLAEQGHRGLVEAIGAARGAFLAEVANPARTGGARSGDEAEAEWRRSLSGAVCRVVGNPSVADNDPPDPCDNPFDGLVDPLMAGPSPATADDGAGHADGGGDARGSPDGEPWTELGMARRMVAEHGKRFRYVVTWRRWLVWDGRRWAHDKTGEVNRAAKLTARAVLREAVDRLEGASRKAAIKAGERAESAAGQRALIELAGTEPDIAITAELLDADPYLLNTPTGVVDLRTGAVGPHDPAQLLTKITTAGYRPGATAPTFTAFLARVQPDPQMRAFLARLLGYSLLGVVTEHILPIFHGAGANGKSTLLDVAGDALGDYAAAADPGLLLERGEVHPTGAADLLGRRLVVGHETDQGRRLAEGTVKRLTGGDKIKARRMREDFWEFTPSHLLVMLTNHRPVVRGDDEGIWRRIRLVPFEVQIPAAEQDSTLHDRLAVEIDGVLAWMVAGLAAWREHGLGEPDGVAAATASYRAESDVFGTFLTQECVVGPHYWAYAGDLFAAWTRYCKAENVDAGSQTAFGKRLSERGYERARSGRGLWRGLGLTDEGDT